MSAAHFVYDVGKMGNGALCGLAAITGSCAVIHPWAAIVIGLVAGFGFVCFSQLVVWCRLDDPLDAISVHAFGGVWGVFATGTAFAPLYHENWEYCQSIGRVHTAVLQSLTLAFL